jgi:hypothetical protein
LNSSAADFSRVFPRCNELFEWLQEASEEESDDASDESD